MGAGEEGGLVGDLDDLAQYMTAMRWPMYPITGEIVRTGKRVRIHAVGRRADLSHKRPTFAVRLPRRWNLPFISFRRGREMCFFLILYWCSAIIGRCGGANILRDNSRFDEFNPRLCGANSRFGPLREFVYNMLIYLTIFAARGRLHGENRQNSRFRREKPGILPHRRNRLRRSLSTIARAPDRKLTPEPRRLPGKQWSGPRAGGRRRGGRA